ncbi:MAG: hypothetical protein LBG77_06120 [Dysgonamonadaceae bacterium]|jgi:hypothetical protein|nr:hypothetical protein [Dysgonamonadaceae bacterium]
MQLDFEIDKLTHSLEDMLTGEILATEVAPLDKSDLQFLTKKNGWKFNWKTEFSGTGKLVYKLVLQRQPGVIQGLVCFKIEFDHVFMDLIETAPHNYGSNKRYNGVMGNLVAYGCKLSFEKGFNGEIAFDSKTRLIEHYIKNLGARRFGGQRMVMWSDAAANLVKRYYPEFFNK